MNSLIDFWISYLPQLGRGLWISLKVTGFTLLFGLPLGLIAAITVQSRNKAIRWVTLVFVEIGRGAPALILLQLAYFGLPQAGMQMTAFVSAVAALSWTTAAYCSEILRSGLNSVAQGQQEASIALGMTSFDTLRYVIVPQGLLVAVPSLLGFAVLMLQATSLCFTIALPELLSQSYIIGSNTFRYLAILSLAGILYAAICIPATVIVSMFERRLSRHMQ